MLAAEAGGLTGVLDAAGFGAARDVRTLAVVPRESSARNDRLEPLFAAGLAARGFAVDPAAPVRLTFASRQESLAEPRFPLSVAGQAGSNSRARVWLQVPLPQLERPETDLPESPGAPRQLWVTLGRPGDVPLWQASLSTRIPSPVPSDLDRRMVDTLLAHWGETAHSEVVPID